MRARTVIERAFDVHDQAEAIMRIASRVLRDAGEDAHPDEVAAEMTRAARKHRVEFRIGPPDRKSRIDPRTGDITIAFPQQFIRAPREFERQVRPILQHELVHRASHKNRYGVDSDGLQGLFYLANDQEITAYARTALTQLLANGFAPEDVIRLLDQPRRYLDKAATASPFIRYYRDSFRVEDRVFQDFLSHLRDYLEMDLARQKRLNPR